ncbi:hypothetical protein [Fictibacillus norfolkensis]|uniref:Uncharacterized protein n=1 Tax=Fictibacillus norfolkensis TaxID=2762233 RepID=A0ABR8SJM9_9BACL|nr:hypothetical protein [Fictibacillus norfolkensis]MBD7963645.1 hypothetical protein [Fictibacillus norfolkensis]
MTKKLLPHIRLSRKSYFGIGQITRSIGQINTPIGQIRHAIGQINV